jgi:hypothetical protein
VIKGLILASLLVGLPRLAGAQPVHDAAPLHVDDTVTRGTTPVVESAARPARPHFDLSDVRDFLTQAASERALRGWLDPTSFRIGSARFARATPGLPAIRRKINRTFLPIPLLRWQRQSSLVTPHGFVSIGPAIVLGRRVTSAPDLMRGGRTIGVAVQVLVWLDHSPSGDRLAAGSRAPGRILSTICGMLER